MITAIDAFQGRIAAHFRELILAMAYLKVGGPALANANANDVVDVLLDEDIRSEPIKVSELLPHAEGVSAGILELYQSKMVATWADLLVELFGHFVRRHFDGIHPYPELKRRSARLDFADNTALRLQVERTLIGEFSFEPYGDRVRTVDVVLNPEHKHSDLLGVVRLHVHIRNAIQHHGGRVHPQMLKDVGASEVSLLNAAAHPMAFAANKQLLLSVPEIDTLKRAFFRLSNEWRLHA